MLQTKEYLHHLVLCLLVLFFLSTVLDQGTHPLSITVMPIWIVVLNTILYPYSWSIVIRIIASIDNEGFRAFFGIFMIIVVIITGILSWYLACFIVPFGFISFYAYHKDEGKRSIKGVLLAFSLAVLTPLIQERLWWPSIVVSGVSGLLIFGFGLYTFQNKTAMLAIGLGVAMLVDATLGVIQARHKGGGKDT